MLSKFSVGDASENMAPTLQAAKLLCSAAGVDQEREVHLLQQSFIKQLLCSVLLGAHLHLSTNSWGESPRPQRYKYERLCKYNQEK